MSTLITGGLGFIGSRLAKRLVEQGEDVVIFDNASPQIHGLNPSLPEHPRIQLLRGDITDLEAINAALDGVSAVVHLAAETGTAQSMYQIAHYNFVNSQGTALLMEALVNHKDAVKRVVLASSRSVYGEGAYTCVMHDMVTPQPRSFANLESQRWEPRCPVCQAAVTRMATPEEARIYPASIYAASKYAQEDLVRITCEASDIGSAILRFQNVYGAGQSLHNPYTGILSIFSTRIRQGLSIPIFEDGLESRDFVHVDDVVSALILALEHPQAAGQTFNVGSGVPTSVLEVANLLFKVFDGQEVSRPTVSGQFRVGDIRHGYANIEHISTFLGWQPMVSLEQGLSDFAEWVFSQPLPQDRLDAALAELSAKKLGGG